MDSNNIPGNLLSRRVCKYDVFISFRGTDTRNTFTDHLYSHLSRKGIFAFKDDKRMEKGQPISSQLLEAIKDSRISIVVFSKDYAASTCCLDEMAAIVDCQKELKQNVFSVFYDVDPSHVRKQTGVYENFFLLHAKKFKQLPDKVDRWKRAMTDLVNSVGWDVRHRPESEQIKLIVQAVIKALDHKFFPDDLIGIQPRVEKLEKLLKLSSEDDDFRVLGIWGMGGIGKTTHATVLYDRISYQFDACCFIEDVSKIYTNGGAIAVQKQILRQALNEKNLETYGPCEISGIVRNRLHNIKVLIILDNVDQLEQLEELAINPNLLPAGSRIVITARDEDVLKKNGANVIHEVPLLNGNDADELLCRKAFRSDASSSSFRELIPEVLEYAQGLPLAIRVLGSFLWNRDATQWRDALDRLGSSPDKKIMDSLHVSFEGLEHDQEKEIFLHIACFFKGEREDYVRRILDSCGLHPRIGIPRLIEKSLITIRNQEIQMHETLQELGKKIVRGKFPTRPEEWSRLWLFRDFRHVMKTESGATNVEAIVLHEKEDAFRFNPLRAEALSKMSGLKLLIFHHMNLSGSLNFLSNNLHYLLWHDYPFTSLPSNFEPDKLVELNMCNSNIKRLWEGIKHLPCLKRMDLSNSKYLIETPHFEGIPNLQRLDLTGCTNLSRVHPSIGSLTILAFLSLRNCSSLVSLDFVLGCHLSSLRILLLSGCTKLERIPNFTGLSNVEYLDLEQCTSLSTVDDSIGALATLKFFSLRNCTNLDGIPYSVNHMTSLQTLDLCGCFKQKNLPPAQNFFHISMRSLICLNLGFCNLREVPACLIWLRCLERLNLEGNNFDSVLLKLDRTHTLLSLSYLNLSHCHELVECLCDLPSGDAWSVGSYFKTVSQSRNDRSGLYLFDCPKFDGNQYGHRVINSWLRRLVEEPRHFRCGFDIVVPGNTIPQWFEYQFTGGSTIKIVKSRVDDVWIGFAFCVAFEVNCCSATFDASDPSSPLGLPHPLYLSFESEHVEESFDMPLRLELDKIDGSKHVWVIYISRPHCHFVKTGAHITFKACPGLKITKWGLHRIWPPSTELSISPLDNYPVWASTNILTSQYNPPILSSYGSLWPKNMFRKADDLLFDYVDESSSSCSRPKIQLPYNWLVTEEEEKEIMEAKAKESNLSNIGFEIGQPL